MKTPKAAKEIRATLSQMDSALTSELSAKQRADLLSEKSKLLVILLNAEREAEESQSAAEIGRLTTQQSESSHRISELEMHNSELQSKVAERLVAYLPDPEAQQLREKIAGLETTLREKSVALELAVTAVTDDLSFEKKVTVAFHMSQQCSKDATDNVARLLGLDATHFNRCVTLNQADLIRWRGVSDPENSAMARIIEQLKYPAAVPVVDKTVMTVDQKMRQAREYARSQGI